MSDIEITPDVSNRGATVTLPPDPLARSHPYQIQVVYTDDARSKPNDTLREINELSTNINDGYGGKFVWLRVVSGSGREYLPILNIGIDVRNSPLPADNPYQNDLAKGAGGAYRYLNVLTGYPQELSSTFVTEIALWRCSKKQDNPPPGWSGKTTDINAGRGGDYLYLVWKATLGRADPIISAGP